MPWHLFNNIIKYFEESLLDFGASLNDLESMHVSENSLWILSLGISSEDKAVAETWGTQVAVTHNKQEGKMAGILLSAQWLCCCLCLGKMINLCSQ